MNAIDRLFDGLDRLIGWVTAALLAVAYALSLFGLIERYAISGSGTDWIYEVVVFGLVWAILLSISRIEHRRAHIRMDIVWRRFSYSSKARAELFILLLGLAFSVFLVLSGWKVVQDAMMWNERTDSSLRLPFWIYYISLSTSFSVHVLFVLHRLSLLSRGKMELETGDLSSEIGKRGDHSD
jgi:C4-dicarboxylate transporter DctQ subunit